MKRGLRLPLLVVSALLLLPTAGLAALGLHWVRTTCRQAEDELVEEQRREAERVRRALAAPMEDLLRREERRPYYLYGYYYVPPDLLSYNAALVKSPLADPGAEPWVVGHLEVLPGGRLRFPFLPEEAEERAGLNLASGGGLADLAEREALAARLRDLAAGRVPGVPAADVMAAGKGGSKAMDPPEATPDPQGAVFACDVPQSVTASNTLVSEIAAQIKEARRGNVQAQGVLQENWERSTGNSSGSFQRYFEDVQTIASSSHGSEPQQDASPRQQVQVRQDQEQGQGPAAVDPQDVQPFQGQSEGAFQAGVEPAPEPVHRAYHYALHPFDTGQGPVGYWRLVQVQGEDRVQAFFVDPAAYFLSQAGPAMASAWGWGLELTTQGPGPGAAERSAFNLQVAPDGPAAQALGDLYVYGAFPEAKAAPLRARVWRIYLTALAVVLVVVAGGAALAFRLVARELELSQRRADFVSSVTHELKTPLTSIRMFAEMLGTDGPVADARRTEYAGFITLEAERLTRLLTNVLDFAKLERGQKTVRPVMGRVEAVVEDLVGVLEPGVRARGGSLELECEMDLPEVAFDADALAQVLVNLVDNAVKYSEGCADRTVRVQVRRRGDGVELAVADRGSGIPEAERERVFNAFYRLGRDGMREGVGLGLALVQRLTQAMGGRIELESVPGAGSTFRVVLG